MASILRRQRQQQPRFVLFDGLKAVPMNDLPDSAWTWYTPHVSQETDNVKTYSTAVGWLFRAVQLRAQALSALPFALVKENGDDYDVSSDWHNECGFMPSPSRLLWLIEAALCLTASAYVYKVLAKNGKEIAALYYMIPTSVSPQIDADRGLFAFTRLVGSQTKTFAPDELLYFWLPDAWTEIGPGAAPAQAAMAAAGVLYNKDQFAGDFFKRGAIKAQLLTVSGTTIEESERERLKNWWNNLFTGIKNSWKTDIINADNLKPVTIGEGLENLEKAELTASMRQDISTTMGIPLSIMAANASNFATAQTDVRNFLEWTIVPEAGFVAEVLNKQLFEPLGLSWEFRPETLDAFQEDENNRAQAFAAYTGGGMDPVLAMQILGVELPPGYTYEKLIAEEQARRDRAAILAERMREQQQQAQAAPSPAEETGETGAEPGESAEMRSDLARWRRLALRRLSEGKPLDYHFESDAIPMPRQAAIRSALLTAATEQEVRAAFQPLPFQDGAWRGYP